MIGKVDKAKGVTLGYSVGSDVNGNSADLGKVVIDPDVVGVVNIVKIEATLHAGITFIGVKVKDAALHTKEVAKIGIHDDLVSKLSAVVNIVVTSISNGIGVGLAKKVALDVAV